MSPFPFNNQEIILRPSLTMHNIYTEYRSPFFSSIQFWLFQKYSIKLSLQHSMEGTQSSNKEQYNKINVNKELLKLLFFI